MTSASEPAFPQTTPPAGEACPVGGCRWHRYAVIVPWSAQILVAVILIQTLYFKFTYAPETQVIFADKGGRPAATAVGVLELVAAILLLTGGRWAAFGAVLAIGLISGAIMTHLTSLGIAIKDPTTGESDGGLLFGLAITVFLGSLVVLAFRWKTLPLADRIRGWL